MILLAQSGQGGAMDLMITLAKIVLISLLLQGGMAFMVWFERRVLARMQWRLGPNRVGPAGLLQPVADGLKLLFKEQLLPTHVRPVLYVLAPCISLTVALSVFAVVPFGAREWEIFGLTLRPWIADLNVGVLFVLGVTSLGVYGIVLAGWSSGNHYALLGAIRSSAQVISYELAMGMAVLAPVMLSALYASEPGALGTLSLVRLVELQEQQGWFVFSLPIAFLVFWVAGIAETNRAPFDLPEAEQELIAGYHTEYSGMRFAMFFMAEYIAMITLSSVAAVIYLGGAGSPFRLPWTLVGAVPPAHPLLDPFLAPGPWWFLAKIGLFMFVFVWLRATFPRFRYDQLMRIGWQLMLPLALLNLILTSVFVAVHDPFGNPLLLVKLALPTAMVGCLALLGFWGAARRRRQQPVGQGA